MEKLKNIKVNKKVIIFVNLAILIFIIIIIGLKSKNIQNILNESYKKSIVKDIELEVYSNENNIIKMLITLTDNENGIKEIEYPDGDKLICSGQSQIGIDYEIQKNGIYIFKAISTTDEEITKEIVIDDNFRANIIPIEKIQEITTEKDYKIDYGKLKTKKYYSIGENNGEWIETDRDIINIDEYDVLQKNIFNEDGSITLRLKKEDEAGNKVEISYKLNEFRVTKDIYNMEEQILEGESLIACIKDNEIKSGNYTLKIKGEEYPAEIYNYNENVNYITNKNLGTLENDNRMLIMKYNGNLNVEENNLITAQARKKGMFIYVNGELINNGEISMTARGANAEGQDVYLWKNKNGIYEYIPALGAEGAKGVTSSAHYSIEVTPGESGNSGINRQTGGGGSGSAQAGASDGFSIGCVSGEGSYGTSYSGGTGGGSASCSISLINGKVHSSRSGGTPGTPNGGKGGSVGGAGNPGGDYGSNGTGGLLITYTNKFNNNGKFSSRGVDSPGGASGGGSINIFYNELINSGIIDVSGGKGNGNGGDGSATIEDIKKVNENENDYKVIKGNLNLINRKSYGADNYYSPNTPDKIIDNDMTGGNGYSWCGGTKFLLEYEHKTKINLMGVYTIQSQESFNEATIYYSEDDSLTLDSNLNDFKFVKVKTGSTQVLQQEIKAKRVMLIKDNEQYVHEFQCFGISESQTEEDYKTIKGNMNLINRKSYKANGYDGGNTPDKIVDDIIIAGNGYNWYGGSRFLLEYNELSIIDYMCVYTTDRWGYSFNEATIYYSEDDSLELDSDLTNFKSIKIKTETLQTIQQELKAKRIMLVKENTQAVYEFQCFGRSIDKE